jgi:hypothetical protein
VYGTYLLEPLPPISHSDPFFAERSRWRVEAVPTICFDPGDFTAKIERRWRK